MTAFEIAALKAELAELKRANAQLFEHGKKMYARIAELEVENARLRAQIGEGAK